MNTEITNEKLEKYFSITRKALSMVKKHISKKMKKEADTVIDMAQRYFDDALWFKGKKDFVNAFACLNYSHGWLDTGSRLGIFKVKNNKLFIVK